MLDGKLGGILLELALGVEGGSGDFLLGGRYDFLRFVLNCGADAGFVGDGILPGLRFHGGDLLVKVREAVLDAVQPQACLLGSGAGVDEAFLDGGGALAESFGENLDQQETDGQREYGEVSYLEDGGGGFGTHAGHLAEFLDHGGVLVLFGVVLLLGGGLGGVCGRRGLLAGGL